MAERDLSGLTELRYPEAPGSKRTGPSRDAGRKIASHAATVRADALAEFVRAYPAPLTADEIADRLGRSILTVRPRCSELHAAGLIEATPTRKRNRSGMSAGTWRATATAFG